MAPVLRTRVARFSLPNGLEVLLAPDPDSPTASVWVWYRVGSKNEWPGVTGASHWVEHMLFLGSPKFKKGEIDRAIVEVGGTLNAFTDNDFTAYFTTVPREHLAVPLAIEADRMTRALIAPKEVERERTIIRSEREGNENWPEFRVDEELYAVAFQRHPYRWDALGYPEDILSLTPAGLAAYYRKFYGTRNAVLVVTGGFEPAAVRSEIRRRFGRLPRSGVDPTVHAVEPPPTGERRSSLSGPGTTPFLEIGWRAPAVSDPTLPATVLIDVLLGGETRLFAAGSMWGRSPEHPSARLYRRLVDGGLAVRATSEWRPRIHPSLFTIHAQAVRGVSLDRIESAIVDEVRRLGRSGPSRSELADARTKIARAAALSYEGATRTGFRLGYFAMLGPPGFEARLLRRVLTVPARDIAATARAVFAETGRTVVQYEPTGGPSDE
ncbi:MAG: insulinase family protein [Thermoplasmata archaeon]|nr:insulinase family protein [Thermoplasmata archaeon]MCI4354243.1 insulinase family protein [Thermoplasmata archaeon]